MIYDFMLNPREAWEENFNIPNQIQVAGINLELGELHYEGEPKHLHRNE